uniref:folate gamma-glutamyl hydrolase n=1 Tax=Electrophorus electricus TaxID=8005 RepID=A0AAY5ELK9_ELEEL
TVRMLCVSAILFASIFRECSARPDKLVNNRPIIGILTQEVQDPDMKPYGRTYIPSSYVKYIESGGGRVIPIRCLCSLFDRLLLIGGTVDLQTSDFAHAAKIYFRLALKANDVGDYFPIWGTCLGFQLLTVLVAEENLLSKTPAENISLPLNFTSGGAASSRMFEAFPPELLTALSQEALAANFHHFGDLQTQLLIIQKEVFVFLNSALSPGRKYPFYGVQWHPEVNRFQWNPLYSFPHSRNAERMSSLLAEFFVNEGNRLGFVTSEESKELIYNYNPLYVANFTSYEQIYFF